MTLEQAITIEFQGEAFYFSYHVTFKYVNSLFCVYPNSAMYFKSDWNVKGFFTEQVGSLKISTFTPFLDT